MYAGIPFGGMVIMFMDYPSDTKTLVGDNIQPTISSDDKDEISRLFDELKEDGEVLTDLGPTFFSEWYGMVKDKFGITWQILYYVEG